MPPIQHTFGTTGNMPSHPGAGITQTPQNGPLQTNNPYFSQPTPSPSTLPVPPPPPPPPSSETNKAEEQQQYTSSSSPSSFPIAVSSSHNYAHESTYPQVLSTYTHESTYPQPAPHTTYAQNPYNNYNDASQLPQEPIPAYTRDVQNDSPDLLAARREYIDVETQIQNETTELNHYLTNPSENFTMITSLQNSIRKLYIRQGALMQRIQDLQDPNSYAFRQSQAMTTTANYPNNQTPLMYDGNEQEREADRNRALALANYTVKPRQKLTGCICLFILIIIVAFVIIALVVSNKKKQR